MKNLLIALSATLLCSLVFSAKLPHLRDEHDKPIDENDDIVYPPQPYNFGYEVRDDNTTNYQNRAEVSDDQGRVKGSYSYVLPDGFVYTVMYEDKKDGNGLEMTLKKEPSGIQVIIPVHTERKHKVL